MAIAALLLERTRSRSRRTSDARALIGEATVPSAPLSVPPAALRAMGHPLASRLS